MINLLNKNLYPLFQITFKLLYTYNFHFRKRNIFQDLKVLIFCNNTLCICSNGTIDKLIVIFVRLNQSKCIMRIFTNNIGSSQYSINYSLRNLRGYITG